MAQRISPNGRRFTPKEKRTILKFVDERGHGGFAEAQRKFGVSYTAIKFWMRPNRPDKKKPILKKIRDIQRLSKQLVRDLTELGTLLGRL